jgi:hypothetical protein
MKNQNLRLLPFLSLLALVGCSTGAVRPDKLEKQVIDNGSGGSPPAWVQDTKVSWIGDGNVHKFKAFHSIKGDERLNACFELARLDAQEQITSEIWADFKATVSHSTNGISESMEDIFVQSRNLETKSNIRGLRFTEAYHQRYLVNGTERVDCFVLGELTDGDYRQMRAHLLSPVVEANPELRKAIEDKHKEMFKGSTSAAPSERNPSSLPAVAKTDQKLGADLPATPKE